MKPDDIIVLPSGLEGREYNIDGICYIVARGTAWLAVHDPQAGVIATIAPKGMTDRKAIQQSQEAMAAGEFKPLQEALQDLRQPSRAAK